VPYSREPFATDVSEGKTDPIYNAHSYHTKVPHKAIMRYILHYTEPGDVVFDGFCGSGMTGVAAQCCGNQKTVESLGYHVQPDGVILSENGQLFSKIGMRHTILNDLSPAATFIAYNYNAQVDVASFAREAKRILNEVENECKWMYETLHTDEKTPGQINYTVWSDVFLCPECVGEIVFFNVAVDRDTGRVKDTFFCPSCNAQLQKNLLERKTEMVVDGSTGQVIARAVQTPVLINYSVPAGRFSKTPTSADISLLKHIDSIPITDFFPTTRIDDDIDIWYERDYRSLGIFSIDSFFTKRNLITLSVLYRLISKCDTSLRLPLLFAFTGILQIASRMSSFRYDARNPNNTAGGILKGALYIPSLSKEARITELLGRKIRQLVPIFRDITSQKSIIITTQSLTALGFPPGNSIDYIFLDPPFGSNLIYSDLSLPWESWLRVSTKTDAEAVVHRRKKQNPTTLDIYRDIMADCFSNAFRVLKPGRWMTVEFHNTKSSVWNAIQEALQHAGFVVADVRTLDKKQGTFKQITAAGAVKQDLVISAYKPNSGLEERFKLEAGTEDGVWDFIRTHLKQLAVFVAKGGQAEVVAERQNYLLFDRMVAFHVQRRVTVPLSAAEFYQGLIQRFSERDGMYFLPDQAAEYDKKRLTVKEVLQLEFFVTDEASAIQWLKQQLTKKPQTFQDLHPQFLKEIGGWQRHEKPLELSELLEENFIRYTGTGEVPSQIHSYLSANFKELRNLSKEDLALRAKAKDRWYVPDPNKASDLEKLRERTLLREFWEYLPPGYKPAQPESQAGFIPGLEPRTAPIPQGKQFRVIRMEAVRAGFAYCYRNRDYRTIIAVARRIPESILQEDQKLLMWYDQALTRSGEEA
jgi:DNA modification methylase